jgi:hypothetical protein
MITMNKPMKNPIAIRVQANAGRRLENGWNAQLGNVGGTFDRRDLSSMWKNPQWSGKSSPENLVQDARLTTWEDITGKK